jgi:hypothetical protein
MDMVRHASGGQEHAAIPAKNAPDIPVELVLEALVDQGNPVLGAEDEVVVEP